MDDSIIQKYYVVDDGEIIVPEYYHNVRYKGYLYSLNEVKRLPTPIQVGYREVNIRVESSTDYILNSLVWKIQGGKYIRVKELPDKHIIAISNILIKDSYKGYLSLHKKILYKILSNYTRLRKIEKLKNLINEQDIITEY